MNKEDKIRIQKIISNSGFASRRHSEELIKKGLVKINGRIAQIGAKADPYKDLITIENKKLTIQNKKYYIMLNKPRGFITTMKDEKNRKCVADLIKNTPTRLYPIGRLDKDSEGLLLMTNDGEFANKISHPSTHITKKYRVTVQPSINDDQLTQLTIGIDIDDEKLTLVSISVIKELKDRSVLEIVLDQGRNRQIRKMCEKVGLNVIRLKRTKIGKIKLGMLQPGKYRELTNEEVKDIF